MRLIRVPHVFSDFVPRSSGRVGACFTLCRATSVGLLGFVALCGAILMGQVDAHAQAQWPSGPGNESIRAFRGTSEVTVISGGDIVAKSSINTQTCAHATSKNPAEPCYYCPKKARGSRCVKQPSSAERATCVLNTDGACTTDCNENRDHPANRLVVPNNSTTNNTSNGGGTSCIANGWASFTSCCPGSDYCYGYCRPRGSCSGPTSSNGGGSANPVSNGAGGSENVVGLLCPPGYRISDNGKRCVSTNPSCPPGYRFDGNGYCVLISPPSQPANPSQPTCWPCPNFTGCCPNGCTIDGKCRS